MPTFTGKKFSDFYKNLLGINQSSNTGVDTTTRTIQDGKGFDTAISLSDDVLQVQPVTDNSVETLRVNNQGGDSIFAVDTNSNLVKVGASRVNATTLFKEMGLYEFSPNAGYHYPLIANNVGMAGAEGLTADNDWGNATDPPTSIDLSGLSDPENAIAVYWYLDNNITLDQVRFLEIADGSSTLNFHLLAFDLYVSSSHGDLSNGVVHANATVSATASTAKTGTFTLDTADIDANKVVIGFVENTGSDDFSVHFNIRYFIR